jgi:IS605 OrfB family transposase
MAMRTIAKVADCYRRDRSIQPTFRELGAVAYDARLYSFRAGCSEVSLATLTGRVLAGMRWREADRQRLLASKWGEADLIVRGGDIYLVVSFEVTEPAPIEATSILGVDLGIRNIATDSDGERYSGETMLAVRARRAKLRAALQRAGSRGAKRHLKKLSGRERRFATHENHVISKSLVRKARDTGRAIALEELKHIRSRVTVRRRQQTVLHSWAFWQLRAFVEYKAALAGVPVVLVDARNTSRACPACSHCDKQNRRSQSEFCCTGCGYSEHADVVGARNVAARAKVSWPIVAGVEGMHVDPGAQLQSLAL